MALQASTAWREQVGTDEDAVFEGFRQTFRAIQDRYSAQHGRGRGLHRKPLLALPARLEIAGDLPEPARQGLFARPGQHEVWLRLSNGGPAIQSDRVRDVRGLAIKVRGLSGPGALGSPTDCQDFLLINLPAFAFPRPDEFVGLVAAKIAGGGALLKYLLGRYGLLGSLRELKRLAKATGRPFTGFASEPFFSAAPFACGPYAARMRLLPARAADGSDGGADWGAHLLAQLRRGELRYALQLQFFVDEARTPIEDASVDWPEAVAPYVTVATLVVPTAAAAASADPAFRAAVEAERFDPWRALAEHRPLGRVMRARKVFYFDSAQNRSAP